ncbi:SET domain-containing protein SmydA-8, isoform A [Amphibalanus amphitrite]|uniref:SET domain-containing protein SmydA-8, isoform A n=1 Tax=Amphibalanus amphitrite TaxID=1232801 RepID=A0A6A4VC36_AMPAM|nr:SET domain-containing protein SmydA-8, isoform A [Amphibalanus amphitrite]
MVGPCADTAPLCLGCYRPVAGPRRCRRCGWPLCSEPCEQSEQHRAECDLTAGSPLGALSGHEGVDWYPCVAVLRLLRLRDTRPADWARLLQLQSHDDERRDTDTYQLEQTTVVDRVRHRFGQFQHSEMLLHRICGIMETNAYEIRLPEINVQGVYARAALFEHDCVPNTHRTFDENLTLVVRAAVDIAQGEHLTSIYTDNLWGTWQRREHLLTSKHFLCECARCCDPTELGTGLSSIRCSLCQYGYIQSVDPLQVQADFRCAACGALVPGAPVRSALAALEAEVQAVEEEPTIDDCERLIQICSSVLHPTHHLMLDLKYPLVHLYNTSEPLPAAQLDRKEQLCKEILSVADVVTPDDQCYALCGQEARDVLCAAISVLRWEPCVQPEGQLGLEAAEELTELDAWLREHLPAAEPVQGDGADSETPTGRRTGPPADTGEPRRGAETGPDCPAQRPCAPRPEEPESHTVSCAEQAPVPRRAPTQLRA